MRNLYKIGLLYASVHLTIVAFGAASRIPYPENVFQDVLKAYASTTGAGAGYGFFAPGVTSQFRARFDIVDKDGNSEHVDLMEGLNREANIRVGNMFSKLWVNPNDEKLRRALTASWAGKVFGRNPQARKVIVTVDSYELPGSQAYLNGTRPQWKQFYRVTYARKAKKDAAS